jgi:hypothetical protein
MNDAALLLLTLPRLVRGFLLLAGSSGKIWPMANIDPAVNAKLIQLYRELARATMEAEPPPKAMPGRAVEQAAVERWRASREKLTRIKGRIDRIVSEQWPSLPREPPEMPVDLNAEKRPAAVIGNAIDDAMRWVDDHPQRTFVIILTAISLFYLLVGSLVGRG